MFFNPHTACHRLYVGADSETRRQLVPVGLDAAQEEAEAAEVMAAMPSSRPCRCCCGSGSRLGPWAEMVGDSLREERQRLYERQQGETVVKLEKDEEE